MGVCHIVDKRSEDKEELRKATQTMWDRFEPFNGGNEFYKEFTNYSAKNNVNLTVKTNNNGLVTAGNISGFQDGAMLVGWIKVEGKKVLHISFRGTENKAKPFMSYFVDNYPNMERQYNNLAPIIEKILKKAKNQFEKEYPEQEFEVSFEGHSLGAALAEKALQKHPDSSDTKFSGVFVANPGSRHYFQRVVNLLDRLTFVNEQSQSKNNNFLILGIDPIHTIKKQSINAALSSFKASILLGTGLYNYVKGSTLVAFRPIIGTEKYDYALHKTTGGVAKFLAVASEAIVFSMWTLVDDVILPKKHHDPRGVTINSAFDNVPQIGGALADRRLNSEVLLTDKLTENKGAFEYHKLEHYLVSFRKVSTQVLKGTIEPKVRTKANIIDIIKELRDNLPLVNLTKMKRSANV